MTVLKPNRRIRAVRRAAALVAVVVLLAIAAVVDLIAVLPGATATVDAPVDAMDAESVTAPAPSDTTPEQLDAAVELAEAPVHAGPETPPAGTYPPTAAAGRHPWRGGPAATSDVRADQVSSTSTARVSQVNERMLFPPHRHTRRTQTAREHPQLRPDSVEWSPMRGDR